MHVPKEGGWLETLSQVLRLRSSAHTQSLIGNCFMSRSQSLTSINLCDGGGAGRAGAGNIHLRRCCYSGGGARAPHLLPPLQVSDVSGAQSVSIQRLAHSVQAAVMRSLSESEADLILLRAHHADCLCLWVPDTPNSRRRSGPI